MGRNLRAGWLLLALLASLAVLRCAPALASSPDIEPRALQFSSGSHVLAFTATGVVVAAADHALRVEFVGARGVSPEAVETASAADGKAAPLKRVTYRNLWEGITLAYDAPAGSMVRSSWTLAPGADPGKICLRYNTTVTVELSGDLRIPYQNGMMQESAPIAWQEIGGRRVPVPVSFRKVGEREVGFQLGSYDKNRLLTIDPTLAWNTFLGGSTQDESGGVAVDASGNIYVTGRSLETWGAPVRAHAGGWDAFVAKLNGGGTLVWNTFLGASSGDEGTGIAVDATGDISVVGNSFETWGDPVRGVSVGKDAFVAKLDSSGALLWNTFLGGSSEDWGCGIVAAPGGNAYVIGNSWGSWGAPIRSHAGDGNRDAFVAKIGPTGILEWETFLGAAEDDYGNGVAIDSRESVYLTGSSYKAWGDPIHEHGPDGCFDAFVARLEADGVLAWNTFLGGTCDNYGHGIAVDTSGNPHVTGSSSASWGEPIREYAGDYAYTDGFVAKLDSRGVLVWNTFLGGSGDDEGHGIAVDASGSVLVVGESVWTWGNPLRAMASDKDAFVAQLGSGGDLRWNAFLGGASVDYGRGIAVDGSGNVAVIGESWGTWGNPIRAFTEGDEDAFVVVLPSGYGDLSPSYVLWARSDTGQAALWELDTATGAKVDGTFVGPEAGIGRGWIASSYAHVDADKGYVLWARSDRGQAALWRISPGTGALVASAYVGSPAGIGCGWLASSYAIASETEGYVLWTRPDRGRATLWKIDPAAGTKVASTPLESPPGNGRGWQASSYAHVGVYEGYVLWTRADVGQAALWQINPANGARTASAYIGSAAGIGKGWQASSYVHVSGTEGYVLWTRPDTGQAALWRIDPATGAMVASAYVGSSAGSGGMWQASSYFFGGPSAP